MPCEHKKTRQLYQQLPPSQGRRWEQVLQVRVCADCNAAIRTGVGKLYDKDGSVL